MAARKQIIFLNVSALISGQSLGIIRRTYFLLKLSELCCPSRAVYYSLIEPGGGGWDSKRIESTQRAGIAVFTAVASVSTAS